jgi:hypothetical protein
MHCNRRIEEIKVDIRLYMFRLLRAFLRGMTIKGNQLYTRSGF